MANLDKIESFIYPLIETSKCGVIPSPRGYFIRTQIF